MTHPGPGGASSRCDRGEKGNSGAIAEQPGCARRSRRVGHHAAAFLVLRAFAGGASSHVNASRGWAQCMLSTLSLTWRRWGTLAEHPSWPQKRIFAEKGVEGLWLPPCAINCCPIPTTAMSGHKKQCFSGSFAEFLQAGWLLTPVHQG